MADYSDRSSGRRAARWAAAFLLSVAGLACLAAGANGAGEFEPNDFRQDAKGPIVSSFPYGATYETVNDSDWYYFYAYPDAQLNLQIAVPFNEDGGTNGCRVELYDRSGQRLRSETFSEFSSPFTVRETLRSTGRFFIHVAECDTAGMPYAFSISASPETSLISSDACGVPVDAKADLEWVVWRAKSNVKHLKRKVARLSRLGRAGSSRRALARAKVRLRASNKALAANEAAIAVYCG